MDIAAFLTDRLDEDAQAARAAGGDQWDNGLPATVWPDTNISRTVVAPSRAGMRDHVCGSILAADAVHIARHDPARVLADVAAKRAVIAEYRAAVQSMVDYPDDRSAVMAEWSFKRAVRALVQPYASHPEFDPAWRPLTPVDAG